MFDGIVQLMIPTFFSWVGVLSLMTPVTDPSPLYILCMKGLVGISAMVVIWMLYHLIKDD